MHGQRDRLYEIYAWSARSTTLGLRFPLEDQNHRPSARRDVPLHPMPCHDQHRRHSPTHLHAMPCHGQHRRHSPTHLTHTHPHAPISHSPTPLTRISPKTHHPPLTSISSHSISSAVDIDLTFHIPVLNRIVHNTIKGVEIRTRLLIQHH